MFTPEKRARFAVALTISVVTVMASTGAQKAASQGLTLDEAVKTALAHNPSLVASSAWASVAEQGVALEKSRKQIKITSWVIGQAQQAAPQIPAADAQPGRRLGEDANASLEVRAEKTLFSSGGISNSIHRAEHLSLGDRLRHERQRQETVYETSTAFYDLLAAQRTLETARQESQSTAEHLAVAQARFEAEAVPKFDVIRAQVQHLEASQRVIDAEAALTLAREALAVVMGVPAVTMDVVAPDDEMADTATLEEYLTCAVQNRPDLLAQRQAVKAAEAGVGVAKAEDRPTVTAYLSEKSYATETPLQTNGWSVGLSMRIPILDGGYSRAKREQARSTLLAAKSDSLALENVVLMEVKQAYASLISSRAQQVASSARLEQSEEAYRLAALRYNSGVATSVEVTDAQSVLTSARNSLVKTRLSLSAARAKLALVTGEPADETGVIEQ